MDQAKQAFSVFEKAQWEVQEKFKGRLSRTFEVLQSINPVLASQVFRVSQPAVPESKESRAALTIQRYYRGFRARKVYRDLLYEAYIAEETQAKATDLQRLEEGLVIMESMKLQQKLSERQFLEKQRELERHSAATVIQRAFRKVKKLPLPPTAVKVIADDPQPIPQFSFLNLSGLPDSESESSEDSEDEVFSKPHPVSRSSEYYEPVAEVVGMGKVDLDEHCREMDITGVSLIVPASDKLEMSFRPVGNTEKERTVQRHRSKVEENRERAQLRHESLKSLKDMYASLKSSAESFSATLIELLEQREALRESVEFSKRLVNYLSKL